MFRLLLAAAMAASSIALLAPVPTLANANNACWRTVPVYTDTPEIARQDGINGTAIVTADLKPNGYVMEAEIARSSGNRWLDEAALDSARQAHFVGNCAATQTFAVEFK